jgi:predicted DNA-binding transcriptional regulator YafY
MTQTSGRLLKLLSLLQARRDWPGEELADRLGVSGRTIRRDVERLRDLGYPVDAVSGPAGGYRLHAGTAMPPLLLDDEEAIAIAVGLRTAAGASVTGSRRPPSGPWSSSSRCCPSGCAAGSTPCSP